jgi:hypothetical protein
MVSLRANKIEYRGMQCTVFASFADVFPFILAKAPACSIETWDQFFLLLSNYFQIITMEACLCGLKHAGRSQAFLLLCIRFLKFAGSASISKPVQFCAVSSHKVLDKNLPSFAPHSMKIPFL